MNRYCKLLAKVCLVGFFYLFSVPSGVAHEVVPLFEPTWETELDSHVAALDSDLISLRTEAPLDWGQGAPAQHDDSCGCNGCCPGWFVSAEYLNWQVERDDLAFAIFDPAALGVPNAGAPVMSLDLGSESGLRVGIGHRMVSGWDVGVAYTYLSSSDSQAFAPGGGRVIAVQSSPATGLTSADSVTATSNFEYNVFDLEAGYWFHPSESVSTQLLGGVRFASIDHLLRAAYNGAAFVNGTADVTTNIDAFGGRVGGAIHWTASEQFGLFAKTSFSLLKSDVNAVRREVNGGAVVVNADRPGDQLLTVIDLAIGLRYDLNDWSVAGGYEWANWFNAVSPLEFYDNGNGGTLGPAARDLGLHGFFVNATYTW